MRQFQTPYEVFFAVLLAALQVAEAKHGWPNKLAAAYLRMKKPELTGGETTFLMNVELGAAVNDYVAHIYDGAPAPYFVAANGL